MTLRIYKVWLKCRSILVLTVLSISSISHGSDKFDTDIYNASAGPVFTLPQWTDGAGWKNTSYYSTIQLADVDGDGTQELLGRGYNGIIVESWDSSLGLWKSVALEGPFPNSSGWDKSQYYSTIQAADVDGDKSFELIGRSPVGIDTMKWNGTKWVTLASASPPFSDKAGWNQAHYYSTIQTADIDGDGSDELLARSASGMLTYKWTGTTWKYLAGKSPPFSDKEGWSKERFYSTIQTADIDGDGSDELLARSASGMLTYKWTGTSWKYLVGKSPGWSDKTGWGKPRFYSTIQTGDINGDGNAELMARSSKGMQIYQWNGTSWDYLIGDSPGWSDKAGWGNARYYSTIQTADIDGDGAAELMARAADGLVSLKWNNGAWSTLSSSNPNLKDNNWDSVENYNTIQTGNINSDKAAELIAKGPYGIRTWSFDVLSDNAWNHPTAYGFAPFASGQALAYDYIGQYLTLKPDTTIRAQYTTDANTLTNYHNCLLTDSNNNQWNNWTALPTKTCDQLGATQPISPPQGLLLDDWNIVAQQIYTELGSAQLVSDYFADLNILYLDIFTDKKNILDAIAQEINGDDMSNKKVNALFESLFLAPFKLSSIFGPAGSAVGGVLSAAIGAGLAAANSSDFQGKWAQAQSRFTTLSEKNQDAIQSSFAFVAGDSQLLAYVGKQKSSGNWNPADPWTVRSTVSEGRKSFATWVYQTLTPSVWKIFAFYSIKSKCRDLHHGINYYFVGHGYDCYREAYNRGVFGSGVSKKQIKKILNPVSKSCTPTQDNNAHW